MQADTSLWNLGLVPHEKSDWGRIKATSFNTDKIRRGLLLDHAFASWSRRNDDPQGPHPPKVFEDTAVPSTPASDLPPAQGTFTSSPQVPTSATPVFQVTPVQSTSGHSPPLATVAPSQRLSTLAAQVPSARPQLTTASPVALAQPPTQSSSAQGSKAPGGGTHGSSAQASKAQHGGTRGGSAQGSNAQHGKASSSKASTGGGAPTGGSASISHGGAQGKRGIDYVTNQDSDDDHKSKKRALPNVPKVQVKARPLVAIDVARWGAPTVLEDQARFDLDKDGNIYELTVSMLTLVHFMY